MTRWLCGLRILGGHDYYLSEHPSLWFCRSHMVCRKCGHPKDTRRREQVPS